MDWVNRMNEAMEYVENNLLCGINNDEISKIMACPFSTFQRSFIQITGIPFSEYIRNRKLSRAAFELKNTDEKVVDIALKYGYNTPDAFSVAFKRLHKISPSEAAKDNVKLTFYCQLHFELTIKGVNKMDYKIIKKEPFKVIGRRRTTPYGAGTWAIVKGDGSYEAIKDLCGHVFDLGLCFGFGEDGSNDYMCGVQWDKEDIEGYESYTYEPATWFVFEAKGKISDYVLNSLWQQINCEFLPQSKYKKSGQPTIEKYISWDEAADMCDVEIWIPVSLK